MRDPGPDESDRLSWKIFLLTVGGAMAFVALVYVFVLR
jgi:hypothetical protein